MPIQSQPRSRLRSRPIRLTITSLSFPRVPERGLPCLPERVHPLLAAKQSQRKFRSHNVRKQVNFLERSGSNERKS